MPRTSLSGLACAMMIRRRVLDWLSPGQRSYASRLLDQDDLIAELSGKPDGRLDAGCAEPHDDQPVKAVGARARPVRRSRCVAVEGEVPSFDRRVAGKADLVHRLAGGFALVKLGEPPAPGRGVVFRAMMAPSGYGSFSSRAAPIAASLPRMARRSSRLPSSRATEISRQSRYPGEFDPVDRAAVPSACPAAGAMGATAPASPATATSTETSVSCGASG